MSPRLKWQLCEDAAEDSSEAAQHADYKGFRIHRWSDRGSRGASYCVIPWPEGYRKDWLTKREYSGSTTSSAHTVACQLDEGGDKVQIACLWTPKLGVLTSHIDTWWATTHAAIEAVRHG